MMSKSGTYLAVSSVLLTVHWYEEPAMLSARTPTVSRLRGSPLRSVIVTGVPLPPAQVMLCFVSIALRIEVVYLPVRGARYDHCRYRSERDLCALRENTDKKRQSRYEKTSDTHSGLCNERNEIEDLKGGVRGQNAGTHAKLLILVALIEVRVSASGQGDCC